MPPPAESPPVTTDRRAAAELQASKMCGLDDGGEELERAPDFDDGCELLEDVEIEELATETQANKGVGLGAEAKQVGKKRKKIKSTTSAPGKSTKRSIVWQEFLAVIEELPGDLPGDPPKKIKKAQCLKCGNLLAADSVKNGTTSLGKHILACQKKREALAKANGQTMLNFQPSVDQPGVGILGTWKFDQEVCRMRLCEMIIRDELPFKFVEREGFKRYTESLCPQFKIPGRHTIRADCVKLFLERKTNLKSFFQQKGMGRVSITTDCWTSINNTGFICVTAHCVDRDWILHKKIISFKKISGHRGEDISASIISSLEDWGLKKLLCCTMDNASANDVAIRHMIPVLNNWKMSILGGKYIHMRCAAHIINLVVSDGIEEIGVSVRRIREVVKWIKASPSRLDGFKGTLQYLKIPFGKMLCLDVPTRWNSTYLMLMSAIPYEDAMRFYGTMNKSFIDDMKQKKYKDEPLGLLVEEDWSNIKKIVSFLGKFYSMTLIVSGTRYATSHLFFKEMCDVFDLIAQLELIVDDDTYDMANKMRSKIEKYWFEHEKDFNPRWNKILYIAALLDPRQKLKHVEKCLKTIYSERRAKELLLEINSTLLELFDFYKLQMTPVGAPMRDASFRIPSMSVTDDGAGAYYKGLCSTLEVVDEDEELDDVSDAAEITIYLTEKQYRMKKDEVDSFDVLLWWKQYGARFPILNEMAKDVLGIPMSSVASESAFSTGGRVLSQFRSSLTPNMVEALICAEDWLRSSSSDIFLNEEEDVPETEQEKEFASVLEQFQNVRVGVGGGAAEAQTS